MCDLCMTVISYLNFNTCTIESPANYIITQLYTYIILLTFCLLQYSLLQNGNRNYHCRQSCAVVKQKYLYRSLCMVHDIQSTHSSSVFKLGNRISFQNFNLLHCSQSSGHLTFGVYQTRQLTNSVVEYMISQWYKCIIMLYVLLAY